MDVINEIIRPDNERLMVGTTFAEFGDVTSVVLNAMIGAGISIAVIYIVVAGIRYMTAQSNPRAKETAQKALTYSVLALILSLGAITVKTIIFSTIGGDNVTSSENPNF